MLCKKKKRLLHFFHQKWTALEQYDNSKQTSKVKNGQSNGIRTLESAEIANVFWLVVWHCFAESVKNHLPCRGWWHCLTSIPAAFNRVQRQKIVLKRAVNQNCIAACMPCLVKAMVEEKIQLSSLCFILVKIYNQIWKAQAPQKSTSKLIFFLGSVAVFIVLPTNVLVFCRGLQMM